MLSATAENRRIIWGLALLVLVVALLPRVLYPTAQYVYIDETYWFHRGWLFTENLRHWNIQPEAWGDEFNHPGIVTAALVGTTQRLVAALSGVWPDQVGWYAFVNYSLGFVRLVMGSFGALAIAALFLMCVTAGCEVSVAFLAAIILALEPTHVYASRMAHCDQPLTCFTSLAVLCWYLAHRRGSVRMLLLSGLVFGIAFVAKSPALVMVPGAVLWLLACLALRRTGTASPVQWLGARWYLLAAVVAAVTIVALYPPGWTDPTATVRNTLLGSASAVGDAVNSPKGFFLWRYVPYLGIIGVMGSEVLLAGGALLLGYLAVRRRWPATLPPGFALLLVLVAASHMLLMGVGRAAYWRYLLPAMPPVALLSASGLWAAWNYLTARLGWGRGHASVLAIFVAACMIPNLLIYPRPDFYNLLDLRHHRLDRDAWNHVGGEPAVAAWLEANTPPGARIGVYGWGECVNLYGPRLNITVWMPETPPPPGWQDQVDYLVALDRHTYGLPTPQITAYTQSHQPLASVPTPRGTQEGRVYRIEHGGRLLTP